MTLSVSGTPASSCLPVPCSDLILTPLDDLSHIRLQLIIDYCATDKAGAQYYEVRDLACFSPFRQLRLLSVSFSLYLPPVLSCSLFTKYFLFPFFFFPSPSMSASYTAEAPRVPHEDIPRLQDSERECRGQANHCALSTDLCCRFKL
jgi:hypothetical protein